MTGQRVRDSAAPTSCFERHGCHAGCFSSCSCIFCYPEEPNHQLSSPAPTGSIPSWVHVDAPISTLPVIQEAQAQVSQMPEASSADPRIHQLVDAVQLITNRLENLNGTVSPTRRVDDDPSDETMTERKIVDSRALLHLRLEPIPSGFRT